jgi:tyrosine-protein phosphatase SIW14
MRSNRYCTRKAAKSAVALLSLIQVALAANIPAPSPATHIHNFGQVNDHIYRGAEPMLVGLQELGAMGVKLIIDLRETGGATDFEKQQAEKLGMKYLNIPLPPLAAPSHADIEHLLGLLCRNDSDRIFVHCRRGKDRTGTTIACYRIQHDGWDNAKALTEAKSYGMSSLERAMRSYIIHFMPLTLTVQP